MYIILLSVHRYGIIGRKNICKVLSAERCDFFFDDHNYVLRVECKLKWITSICIDVVTTKLQITFYMRTRLNTSPLLPVDGMRIEILLQP